MSADRLLMLLTLALYFGAAVCWHAHLFAGSERARVAAPWLAGAGAAVHFAAIGVWCVSHRGTSLLRDPGMPLSLVAFFLASAQAMAALRPALAAAGSLSLPLAFIAQSTALLRMEDAAPGGRGPAGPWLSPHVLALVLGFVAFTLAFSLAVLYLVESRLLKSKQLRGLFRRLPALESIGDAAHWLAAVGFSMLTLGIVTGAIAAPRHWGPGWYLDPRTLTSLVAWCIYAVYVGGSTLLGWRGRRTTYFLIAGYAVVLAAFLASLAWPKNTERPAARAPGAAACLAGLPPC